MDEGDPIEKRDTEESPPQPQGQVKADPLSRLLARIFDVIIFSFLTFSIYPVGIAAGFFYILVADGLMDGRSLGKRLIGLKIVKMDSDEPAGFRESLIRNAPVAGVLLFAVIPILGWILFFTLGLLTICIESYLVIKDEQGQRFGDLMAGTIVQMTNRPDSGKSGPPQSEPDQPDKDYHI